MKVNRVTIIDFKCQQKHMANLSYLVLHDRERILGTTISDMCFLVWLPISVGALDFEYARSPCQLNGNKFFASGRT